MGRANPILSLDSPPTTMISASATVHRTHQAAEASTLAATTMIVAPLRQVGRESNPD